VALGTELECRLLDGRQNSRIPAGPNRVKSSACAARDARSAFAPQRGPARADPDRGSEKVDAAAEELLRELAELEKKNVSAHQKSFLEKIKAYFAADESEGKE